MLMNKQTYLKRFSKLIRWRLPSGEAEDAISDYAELLNAQPEDGEALLKNLGTPFAAAMQIKPAKEYYHWTVVSALLALCAVYFFCGLFAGWYWRYTVAFNTVLFYFAVGLTAFWKWKSPRRKEKPSGLLPALLCMLIPIALLAAVLWFVLAMVSGLSNGNFDIPAWEVAPVISTVLRLTGGISLAAALAGLIQCRTRDRRWFSVVVLALTLLFLCTAWFWMLKCLSDPDAILPMVQKTMVLPCIAGTAGVIWSLC